MEERYELAFIQLSFNVICNNRLAIAQNTEAFFFGYYITILNIVSYCDRLSNILYITIYQSQKTFRKYNKCNWWISQFHIFCIIYIDNVIEVRQMMLMSGGVVTTISFLYLYICNINLDATKQKLLAPPIAATTPQDCKKFNLPQILDSVVQRYSYLGFSILLKIW